jgi:ABC-type antimicrobial peptide transport system permease subunit
MPAIIARTVLARIAMLLGTGLAAGLVLALLLRHVAASIIAVPYGHDGVLIAALVLLLAAVCFAAGILPAYRAATIDPMRALRTE